MAHPDFEEFIDALERKNVRYLIIGAHALAYHASPRATKDLDLLVEATESNARRFLAALKLFFNGTPPPYSVADVLDPDLILQLGVAPVRIDIFSHVPGIRSFAAAWRRRVDAKFGPKRTHFVSREDLISAKTAAGRLQDQADLAVLRRTARKKQRRK